MRPLRVEPSESVLPVACLKCVSIHPRRVLRLAKRRRIRQRLQPGLGSQVFVFSVISLIVELGTPTEVTSGHLIFTGRGSNNQIHIVRRWSADSSRSCKMSERLLSRGSPCGKAAAFNLRQISSTTSTYVRSSSRIPQQSIVGSER